MCVKEGEGESERERQREPSQHVLLGSYVMVCVHRMLVKKLFTLSREVVIADGELESRAQCVVLLREARDWLDIVRVRDCCSPLVMTSL